MAKNTFKNYKQEEIQEKLAELNQEFKSVFEGVDVISNENSNWKTQKKTIEYKHNLEITKLQSALKTLQNTIESQELQIQKLKRKIIDTRQKTIIELLDSENDKKFIKFVENKQSQTGEKAEFRNKIDQLIREIDKCLDQLQNQ